MSLSKKNNITDLNEQKQCGNNTISLQGSAHNSLLSFCEKKKHAGPWGSMLGKHAGEACWGSTLCREGSALDVRNLKLKKNWT